MAVVVDFPQTLMEFQFPPLHVYGKRVSDFIAAFVAPPLQSSADLADAVSQQEFNLNAPIVSTYCYGYLQEALNRG